MASRFWGLTKLGKKISGDISQKGDPELDILRCVHEGKRVSTDEITLSIGANKSRVKRMLRNLRKRGLVRELTIGGESDGHF